MIEVRHTSFNPRWGGAFLDTCREQERDGFALVRMVPVTEYEAIGVFEKHPPAVPVDREGEQTDG